METIIIVALLALLGWERYQNRLERGKMLNAIKSRDAIEMTGLEMADKTKVKVQQNAEPDLVPESNITDEDFLKRIKNQLNR